VIVRGNFNVDVSFVDSTSTSGLRVDRRIVLQSTDDYDSGKVAVVSGTCNTAGVTLTFSTAYYTNSAGNPVTFGNVSRIAFSAGSTALVSCFGVSGYIPVVLSRADQVAVSEVPSSETGLQVVVLGNAGTSRYTLVLYGS